MKTAFCIDASGSITRQMLMTALSLVDAMKKPGDVVICEGVMPVGSEATWNNIVSDVHVRTECCYPFNANKTLKMAHSAGAEHTILFSDCSIPDEDRKRFDQVVNVEVTE